MDERDDAPDTAEAGPSALPVADAAMAELPHGYEPSLPSDAPRIALPGFEGPLDLLLFLIRRHKMTIEEIRIAPITHQYMEYLAFMQELNLELAGEFMVMAATLIHIKSKTLVPVAPTEAEGEEEVEDPAEELLRRLQELQRYKEAAGVLHQKGQIRAASFTRPAAAVPSVVESGGDEMLEAGLFDLVAAFKELLDRRKALLTHDVGGRGKSVEERSDEILAMLREGDSLEFADLFEDQVTKADMIVTFLALLELIRLRRIKVYQRGLFGPIRVFRPVGPQEAVPGIEMPAPGSEAPAATVPPSSAQPTDEEPQE